MAKCECGVEMLNHKGGCKFKCLLHKDGRKIARDKNYGDLNDFCHDCGIPNGKGYIHHVNCDVERCPDCAGQLLSCGCEWEAFVR